MIESVYYENGIKVERLKKVGKPLRLRSLWCIDLEEIPTNSDARSWKIINDQKRQSKKKDACHETVKSFI